MVGREVAHHLGSFKCGFHSGVLVEYIVNNSDGTHYSSTEMIRKCFP